MKIKSEIKICDQINYKTKKYEIRKKYFAYLYISFYFFKPILFI